MKHILHVFPAFAIGGIETRMARIMNHLGGRARHTLVSMDGRLDALDRVHPDVSIEVLPAPPGLGLRGRLLAYRQALRTLQPDVLLTNNWGAIEWALAHRLWPVGRHLHFENGFGPDEAGKVLWRRKWGRRLALAHSEIYVPSHTLMQWAQEAWGFPADQLSQVADGIALSAFANLPLPDRDPPTIGTLAVLRAEKNIGLLLRCSAALQTAVPHQLRIFGDGPLRGDLEAEARALGLPAEEVFVGFVDDPAQAIAELDVFVLSSNSEQTPNALMQAMAAGRPVLSTRVGDVPRLLPPSAKACIVAPDDERGLQARMEDVLRDAQARVALGRANQQAAQAFDEAKMFAAYEALLLG